MLVTDSKSILTALSKGALLSFKINYILFNIKDLIHKLKTKGVNIEFIWVPSHSGIPRNEKVDSVVRMEEDEDHTNILKVPFTDYNCYYKENLKTLWKSYWQLSLMIKGKWYAEVQADLPLKPWFSRSNQFIHRKYLTIISRMRIGHWLIPSHLHKINILPNSNCQYCNQEDADLQHIIFKCPSQRVN
jgi:hypothetical protein